MKSLIVGASGQVGGLLLRSCTARGFDCIGTSFKSPRDGLVPLDIRDAAAVDAMVQDFKPDVVFLPGALTFVDYCQLHPEECFAINVDGTANMARAVRRSGSRMVFFSTEQVFSDSPDAYPEDAPTAPVNTYAESKVRAEQEVRTILPDSGLILRASWVYGPEIQRKNFLYRAVSTLRAGKRLQVPSDQFGQPTYSVDLATTALALLQKGLSGTFHTVGPKHINRLEFAELIAKEFGLDASLIDGQSTASLSQPAPRPLFIKVQRNKLIAALGNDPIRSPEEALIDTREGDAAFRP